MIAIRMLACGLLATMATLAFAAAPVEKNEQEPASSGGFGGLSKQVGAWSKNVNGLQARIVLKHSAVLNGTPLVATWLELRNVSDPARPMKVALSSERMQFRALDAGGNERPRDSLSYGGKIWTKSDLVLPLKGMLSVDVSSHGCGIQGDMAALVDLGFPASFIIKPTEGACSLDAVLEIPKADDKQGLDANANQNAGKAWHGRIELPPVLIPVNVEQPDAAKVAGLIAELGPRMIKQGGTADSEEATRALSLIDDARVIPWYVKAMDTSSYQLKYTALDRLARFEGDEAFRALTKGAATQGKEMTNSTTDEVARQSAESVRHAAACALTRSPHPDAKRLLLTKWNDSSSAVRITVLHALGKMTTDESLALLKKMSNDPDGDVRGEALRYLKLRTEAPAAPPDGDPQLDL